VPVFPICIDTYENLDEVPEVSCLRDPNATIEFKAVAQEIKLSHLMQLYWQVKTIKIDFNGVKIQPVELTRDVEQKKLVCDEDKNFKWGDSFGITEILEGPPPPAGSYHYERAAANIRLYFSDNLSRLVQIGSGQNYKFYIRRPFIQYYFQNRLGEGEGTVGVDRWSEYDTGADCFTTEGYWDCVFQIASECIKYEEIETDYGSIKDMKINAYTSPTKTKTVNWDGGEAQFIFSKHTSIKITTTNYTS
jgi:hypothetical protein